MRPGQKIAWQPHPGPQWHFLASTAFEVLYGGARGGGKALDVDTPIPSPGGWRRMGDLDVGDTVFDEQGRPCTVYTTSEIMHDRPCFRVEFSDGTWIVADAEHRWHTFTDFERKAAVKRTPEYREARRARRASRVSGRKSARFTASLSARNTTVLRPPTKAPPDGGVRTTAEIAASLTACRGHQVNHSIACAGALQLPDADLPVDPYVLGVWLGDGTSAAGAITCHTDDTEIVDHIRAAGYAVKKWGDLYDWGIAGLQTQLRALGVFRNKHIPQRYLRASIPQRLALLQGLLDTDGWADLDGQANFTSCDRRLARQVEELVLSLGIRTVAHAKRAKVNGRVVNVAWNISFRAPMPVFRLTRKRERQKTALSDRATRRYITAVVPVPSRPVKCIGVTSASRLFLAGRAMVPTHNTDCLLYGSLRQVHNPEYRALLLRRTFPELREVMDRAILVFPSLGGKWVASEKRFVFPSGATVEFGYCETLADVGQYQGQEYTFVGFDEIGNLADERVWDFLLTCIRSTDPSLVKMARCTANPGGAGHGWLKRRFIAPCPPDGTPVLIGKRKKRTRAFVQARVYDNPSLRDNDPEYIETLENLPEVMRKQHLDGDWEVGSGLAFEMLTDTSHVVPVADVPGWAQCFAAFDWGYGHKWCASVAYMTPAGKLHVIDSAVGRRQIPSQIVGRWKDVLASRGIGLPRLAYTVAGADVKIRDEARGASGPSVMEQFGDEGWWLTNADQSRVAGYSNLLRYITHHLIEWEDTPGNRAVIANLKEMVTDPDFPSDVLKVNADPLTGEGGDDPYDATRYLAMSRPLTSVQPDAKSALEQRMQRHLDRAKPRTTTRRVTRALATRSMDA